MTKLTRFLTPEERAAMNDDAIASGFYRDDRRVFTAGMGWHAPWYWDPPRNRAAGITKEMTYDEAEPLARAAGFHLYGFGHLSIHYWRDHADIRPPLIVVCPNGEQWEMDRKSSNGAGWVVSGEWPHITAAPSIVVNGYHGYLRDGVFTADLDGRGPIGIARPNPPPRTT